MSSAQVEAAELLLLAGRGHDTVQEDLQLLPGWACCDAVCTESIQPGHAVSTLLAHTCISHHESFGINPCSAAGIVGAKPLLPWNGISSFFNQTVA